MSKFKTIILSTTVLGLYGIAYSAAAQDDDTDASERRLNPISVTAQRRTETITDVPLSITAKSGDELEKSGVSNSSDLSGVVPNLQVNSAYGNTQPNFSLRGVSVANEYNANQASPVGVYVDDAYLASRTFHGMQIFDLERVEVLRGPQGTLYGRNTTGGAINFITASPDLEGSEGNLTVGIGNFNMREAKGAFETTFAEDKAGARLAFNYRESDGTIKNLTAGQDDLAGVDSINARLSLRFKPIEALDLKFKVYAGEENGTQAAVHGIGVLPGGVNPITAYTRDGLDFFDVEMDRVGKNATDASGFYIRGDYTVNDAWTLSYIGSYDEGSQRLGQDSDGSPIDELYISWNSDFEQINQELRLAYAGESVSFQGGLYYGEDEVATINEFDFFLFGGTCVPSLFFACTVRQEYTQTRESAAIFAQGDWEFVPNWTITAGLRYTDDSNEYADGIAYLADETGTFLFSTIPGVLADGVTPAGPTDALAPLNESDGDVTGRFALSWAYREDALVYASFSRGYRAGAFNGGGYSEPSSVSYVDPESVDAFEIGTKGSALNGAMLYAIAAFHYDYEDQQVQEVVGPVSFLRSAGGATIDGLEIEAQVRLIETLSVNTALGLLDTEYDDLMLSSVDLSGNALPFAPETTFQLGFDWEAFKVADGAVRLNGNLAYASKAWFSPFNGLNGNERLAQGDHTKLNLSASYETGAWTARIWGNNVTSTESFAYGLDLRDSFGYDFLVPSAPATYGVSLGYAF